MVRKTTAGGLVAGVVLAAVVLTGCSSNSSDEATDSTTTSTTSTPSGGAAPCTQTAITAGATSSRSGGPATTSVDNFGCSGSWAYADVNEGSGSNAYAAVIVLQAKGSTWTVADRGNACEHHLVPSSIYAQACTTS